MSPVHPFILGLKCQGQESWHGSLHSSECWLFLVVVVVVVVVDVIPGNTECSAENTVNRAKTDTAATQV